MRKEEVKVNTAKRLLSRGAKRNIFVVLMLIIPVVHFIIFWGVVNFNSILLAFQRLDINTGKNVFTFDHFSALQTYWKIGDLKTPFLNTLLTFGFLTVFLLPWGFFVTYFLYKKIRLSGFWRMMLFLPTLLPAVAMTSIFVYIVNAQGPAGIIYGFLSGNQSWSLMNEPKTARWMVLLYMFWTGFGGSFILFSGAMSRISKEVVESAYLDGASMGTELFRITIPLCWPTISMLLLLNLAATFTASGPILLLTRGQAETSTVAYWIFSGTMSNWLNQPAALGLICTAVMFPIILLARWGLGKIYADVEF